MENSLNCSLCDIEYSTKELKLINGDNAECPHGHKINLISIQTYDYVSYIDIINSIAGAK